MMNSGAREDTREVYRSTPSSPQKPFAFAQSALAGFWRENTVASLWHEITDGDHRRPDQEVKDYNPYARIKALFESDVHHKLAGNISDGDFDHIYSDAQLRGTVADILYELDLKEQTASDPTGYFVGALVGGIFDPTSYIPMVGQMSKATKLGKIGLLAFNSTLSAGVSEGVLQLTQRDRSWDETLMNVGISGVLGGGIGMFASAAHPKSLIHPDNPDNPLSPANLSAHGEVTRTLDGQIDELTPDELSRLADDVRVYSPSAAGADTAFGPMPEIARSVPTTKAGKAVRAFGDWFNSNTIKGRVLRSSVPSARYVGALLFDPAGIILKQNLAGVATAKSADTIKKWRMTEFQRMWDGLERETRKLSMDLKGKKKADFNDLLKLTQRELYADDDVDLAVTLQAKYGDDFEAVKAKARDFAETIHQFNERQEVELVKFGLMQDLGKIAKLEAEVVALREQVKSANKASPDAPAPVNLDALRDQRNRKIDELDMELAKPAPLGRSYGHAQMWNRELVLQNPAAFKSYLHDVLSFEPDASWLLSNHDITLTEFKALDADAARAIREDWAGDEHVWRIEQLEYDLKAAKAREKEARLDLAEELRSLGLAKRDETNVSLSEARARRDAFHSRVAANRDKPKAKPSPAETTADPAQPTVEATGNLDVTMDDLSPNSVEPKQEMPEGAPDGNLQVTPPAPTAERLRERARVLDERLKALEARHEEATASRRRLDEVVRNVRKDRNIEATSVAKVKKALRKAGDRPKLNEVIDDIYEGIAQRGKVPHAMLDRVLDESDRTSGRIKARGLHLDSQQRLTAIKSGWLRDDLSNILYAQADQVSAELSIREAVGIGPGQRFESWAKVHEWITNQYDDLLAETTDQTAKNKLVQEQKRVWMDIVEARDRMKGGNYYDDGTATGIINYGISKMAQVNLLRYGSGFLVSSQTDLATVALRHGAPAKLIARYGKQVIDLMRDIHKEDPSHLMAFARSTEIGAGVQAVAKRLGTENAMHGQLWGYGIGVGATRKVTAKLDQGLERLTEFGVRMGGMPLHNTFWKLTAALAMRDRLADLTSRYASLKPEQIADLASFGIGKDEAERIARFIEAHGHKDADGVFDPRLEDWTGEEGLEAARDFEMAILRDMDRAVNTPDVGDTPRLFSHPFGKLLFTFQTFAFTFVNQYAYPMSQRVALFKDKQAMTSLAYLLAASTAVMVAKDFQNGRDPSNRFSQERLTETMYEIVDRSGLIGYMSPYVDSALKLTSGYTGFGGGQRYARNGWLESLLGVNFSMIKDVQNVGAAFGNPDYSIVDKFEKAATIAPYKAQFQLLGRFLPQ